jgi:hypothetical protein
MRGTNTEKDNLKVHPNPLGPSAWNSRERMAGLNIFLLEMNHIQRYEYDTMMIRVIG